MNFKIEKELCMTKGKIRNNIFRKIFNNFLQMKTHILLRCFH